MEERIKHLEQRVTELEKKVAAGTTTDITLVAEEVVRRLVEAGRSSEEANEIVQSKSGNELTFILACDELVKESNQ